MYASYVSYMRLGIVHCMAFPSAGGDTRVLMDSMRRIALDPFFQSIEITHIADPDLRKQVKQMLALAKVSVGFAAQPLVLGGGLNINSLDEDVRARSVASLKGFLDEAKEMGAETFEILSGKDPGPESRGRAVQALVDSLKELCQYSREIGGPTIVAEVFDCEIDKCALLGPAAMAARVGGEVASSYNNFGLLVDLSHIPLLGESPAQALQPVKDYLHQVHLGNAVVEKGMPGHGDQHPAFGTPGGVNDVPELAEFLKELFNIGFLGGERSPLVGFEIKPMEGQDPELVIANAKRVFNQAWALL